MSSKLSEMLAKPFCCMPDIIGSKKAADDGCHISLVLYQLLNIVVGDTADSAHGYVKPLFGLCDYIRAGADSFGFCR